MARICSHAHMVFPEFLLITFIVKDCSRIRQGSGATQRKTDGKLIWKSPTRGTIARTIPYGRFTVFATVMIIASEARDLEGFFQRVDSEILTWYEARKKEFLLYPECCAWAASQFAHQVTKLTPPLAVPRCGCWMLLAFLSERMPGEDRTPHRSSLCLVSTRLSTPPGESVALREKMGWEQEWDGVSSGDGRCFDDGLVLITTHYSSALGLCMLRYPSGSRGTALVWEMWESHWSRTGKARDS